MSSFTSPLKVTPTDDGKRWVLLDDFEYYQSANIESKIKIPKGFITDYASIPRVFWVFLPPYQKLYGKPAILHDYLCVMNHLTKHPELKEVDGVSLPDNQPYTVWGKNENKYITITRKVTDKIFLEAMLVIAGNSKWERFKAKVVYCSVRLYATVFRIK